jgi:hypothetical protein
MSIPIIITNAGRAAQVAASHTGTNAIAITAIGVSASTITPSATATALTGEIKRVGTIGGDQVAANMISVTLLDDSADAYELRAIGSIWPMARCSPSMARPTRWPSKPPPR